MHGRSQQSVSQSIKMARHFLVLAYPLYGHVNPALHFARRLAAAGARVTFTSTVSAHRRGIVAPPATGDPLYYAPFSDGYDDGVDFDSAGEQYLEQLRRVGPTAIAELMRSLAEGGHAVTCVVYNILLPWAAGVAGDMGASSTLLWIQPAAVFTIYHHYFHGYGSAIEDRISSGPSSTVELPGLPSIPCEDLPSFVRPTDSYPFVLKALKDLFQTLDGEEKPHVVVNTFDALEPQALGAIDAVRMTGVGPLISPSFLGGDGGSGGAEKGSDCVQWLSSKPRSSVVYVSFGTVTGLPKQQMDEILNGLVESKRPFLLVCREHQSRSNPDVGEKVEAERGMVVPWCSQVEVLSHPSVGCFLTHSGWNSTTESLSTGVPMLCFPHWSDQMMNARLVEDVWRTGMRLKVEEGVLRAGELKACLEEVMGEGKRGKEMWKNAERWRELARKAVKDGGSSDQNIRAFAVEETPKKSLSDR